MGRSTDVQESIAGYYYQFLLAVRELCKLGANNQMELDNKVGIEKGADIKIYKKNYGDISIEAKFYKTNGFSRKSEAIIKTIFNFHNNFKVKNDIHREFIFSTNVKVIDGDIEFFENWPSDANISDESEYIRFIKECVVRQSIQKEIFRDRFDKYKTKKVSKGLHPKNKKQEIGYYLNLLIDDLAKGELDYLDFSDLMNDNDIKEFISKIKFNFSNRDKFEEIKSIKADIFKYLTLIDNTLQHVDCDMLTNAIVDKFFLTTLTKKSLKVEFLLELINSYKTDKDKFREEYVYEDKMKKLLDTIECEIERLDYDIENSDERIILKEQFVNTVEFFSNYVIENKLDSESYELLVNEYLLNKVDETAKIIPNIAKLASILSVYGEYDDDEIKFVEKGSINNVILDNDNKYCFKLTDSYNMRTTKVLINEFIKNTQDDIGNINGDEVVVFSTPRFKEKQRPCNYNLDTIELMVHDIKNIDSSMKTIELYGALDYRCDFCWTETDESDEIRERIINFKGGCLCKKC